MPMSLAVVFIGIWTVPSTLSAQLSFTSPAPLNNDAAGDTAHDIHPELACDGAGTCVTVWRRRDDLDPARADRDVLFARSSEGDRQMKYVNRQDFAAVGFMHQRR